LVPEVPDIRQLSHQLWKRAPAEVIYSLPIFIFLAFRDVAEIGSIFKDPNTRNAVTFSKVNSS